MKKLRRCQCDGSGVLYEELSGWFYVECDDCNSRGVRDRRLQGAIDGWNNWRSPLGIAVHYLAVWAGVER